MAEFSTNETMGHSADRYSTLLKGLLLWYILILEYCRSTQNTLFSGLIHSFNLSQSINNQLPCRLAAAFEVSRKEQVGFNCNCLSELCNAVFDSSCPASGGQLVFQKQIYVIPLIVKELRRIKVTKVYFYLCPKKDTQTLKKEVHNLCKFS